MSSLASVFLRLQAEDGFFCGIRNARAWSRSIDELRRAGIERQRRHLQAAHVNSDSTGRLREHRPPMFLHRQYYGGCGAADVQTRKLSSTGDPLDLLVAPRIRVHTDRREQSKHKGRQHSSLTASTGSHDKILPKSPHMPGHQVSLHQRHSLVADHPYESRVDDWRNGRFRLGDAGSASCSSRILRVQSSAVRGFE
jgi:hypothetical protein